MKVEFEIKSFHIAIIFLILFLFASSFIGLQRVKKLNKEIEQIDNQNRELESDIETIDKLKNELQLKVDSLEKKETFYKNKYYVTNKKLQELLADYSNSDNDTKNKLFTDLINN